MNFLKSVFADDPDPASPESGQEDEEREDPDLNPDSSNDGGGWNFGGLIKTLTAKSESVIETYRRDLKEFGSGLKKEIEVAHGSLENVGHVVDELGSSVLKGTAQIISRGKDTILAIGHESDSDNGSSPSNATKRSSGSKPYSRFDAQISAIEGDINTYCEEVEDFDDYSKWKLGFSLEQKGEEIQRLLEENGTIDSLYKKVVPNSVDHDTFWLRYFYRVHKLKQAEDLMASIVKRAISTDEEELSWDVDDDEDEENQSNANLKADEAKNPAVGDMDLGKSVKEEGSRGDENVREDDAKGKEIKNASKEAEAASMGEPLEKDLREAESDGGLKGEISLEGPQIERSGDDGDIVEKSSVDDGSNRIGKHANRDEVSDQKTDCVGESAMIKEDPALKPDEKAVSNNRFDQGETSKDNSDFSAISGQPSAIEEEDLGWDEIEDLSSIDERKVAQGGSINKADMRKRLSAAEEDEDLSWDIEDDDDEPAKA